MSVEEKKELFGNQRVKIEPKTTFANERVFQTVFSYGWGLLFMAVVLMAKFFNMSFNMWVFAYLGCGIFIMTYAVATYYYRYYYIDSSSSSSKQDYSNTTGPFVYTAFFLTMMLLSTTFSYYQYVDFSSPAVDDYTDFELIHSFKGLGVINYINTYDDGQLIKYNSTIYKKPTTKTSFSKNNYFSDTSDNTAFLFINKLNAGNDYTTYVWYQDGNINVDNNKGTTTFHLPVSFHVDYIYLYNYKYNNNTYQIMAYTKEDNKLRVLDLNLDTKTLSINSIMDVKTIFNLDDQLDDGESTKIAYFFYKNSDMYIVTNDNRLLGFNVNSNHYYPQKHLKFNIHNVSYVEFSQKKSYISKNWNLYSYEFYS